MKKKISYGAVLAWLWIIVMLLSGCESRELVFEEMSEDVTTDEMYAAVETSETAVICVHVCGEVVTPGVYEAPAGSRYQELIGLAGGMTENAARDYLNLARTAIDGEKIVVPRIDEVSEPYGAEEVSADDGRVNINTASLAELMNLPGIGEAKAGAIIAYREDNGAFAAIEDVMKVAGIKEAAFTKIREHIKVK